MDTLDEYDSKYPDRENKEFLILVPMAYEPVLKSTMGSKYYNIDCITSYSGNKYHVIWSARKDTEIIKLGILDSKTFEDYK